MYVHVIQVFYHMLCCNLHSLSSGDLSVILSSEIKNAKEKGKQNITSLKACSFKDLSSCLLPYIITLLTVLLLVQYITLICYTTQN